MNYKEKKRVQVAKDAIEQIKLKRYIADSGTYVQLHASLVDDGVKPICQIVDEAITRGTNCEVCAKGSLLISHIRTGGKYEKDNVVDMLDDDPCMFIDDQLQDLFTERQLTLMENYFEGNMICAPVKGYDHSDYENFKKSEPKDDKRLLRILENVVENEGVFKPEKL